MIPRHLVIAVSILLVAVLTTGVYVWHMRGRAAQIEPTAADTRPVTAPVAGPTEQVTLYVAYDDPGVLRAQTARIPLPSNRQQRAEELMRALVGLYLDRNSPHPLAPGSEIRNVYLTDQGLAVIDTDAVFADGHRSGVLVESLTVVSIAQTLTANVPDIRQIKLLVEGKERETLAGHADLSNTYDVSAMQELVSALSAP